MTKLHHFKQRVPGYIDIDELLEFDFNTVEDWISQYSCDWVVCNEYLDGYTDALNCLKENLK